MTKTHTSYRSRAKTYSINAYLAQNQSICWSVNQPQSLAAALRLNALSIIQNPIPASNIKVWKVTVSLHKTPLSYSQLMYHQGAGGDRTGEPALAVIFSRLLRPEQSAVRAVLSEDWWIKRSLARSAGVKKKKRPHLFENLPRRCTLSLSGSTTTVFPLEQGLRRAPRKGTILMTKAIYTPRTGVWRLAVEVEARRQRVNPMILRTPSKLGRPTHI